MTSRFVLPLADVGAGITPSSGAQLFFYETGTTTPKDTYSDAAGTIPNANPVVANSLGVFPDIFITGTYKVVLKSSAGVQYWAADPVEESSDLNSLAASGSTVSIAGVTAGNLATRYSEKINVKVYGAIGDGTTDELNAIVSAQTTAASDKTIFFPVGSYKVDVTSASLILTSDLEFAPGAKLVIHRTSGTNYVDIRGDIKHSNQQIIDVTNVYATKALWDAAYNINGGTLPIYFGYGTSNYNEFNQTKAVLVPQLFGAAGKQDTPVDDAYPVQISFDMHRPTRFITSHNISQVTVRGNERDIDSGKHALIAMDGAVDRSSLVEIKCGVSGVSLRADATYSQYYQATFHYYTNDLTETSNPNNNDLDLEFANSYIGVCVGGLPGQTVFQGQAASATAPEAIDAPVSETNLKVRGLTSLCNIFMNQPNGKIQSIGSQCSTTTLAGFAAPSAGRSTLPLSEYATLQSQWVGSELDFVGGEVVNTEASNTVPTMIIKGGRINLVGTHLEPTNQIHLRKFSGVYASNGSANAGATYYGQSKLCLDQVSNMGWNGAIDSPMVLVEDDCEGHFIMTNCEPIFNNAGYLNRTAPFIAVTDTFSGLDANATMTEIKAASSNLHNPYFKFLVDNSIFRDQPWESSSFQLIGMVRGLSNNHIGNITAIGSKALDLVDPSDSPGVPSIEKQLIGSASVAGSFAGTFDQTGEQIGAARTTGTHAGWAVTTSGGTAQIDGVAIADGPVIPGDNITSIGGAPSRYTHAIRLTTATVGHTAYITSPAAGVWGGKAVRLGFFIRSISGAPSTNNFIARIKGYKQDGATAVSEYNAAVAYESNISSEWEYVSTMVEVDKNAVKGSLFFYVENGCAVEITGITIN